MEDNEQAIADTSELPDDGAWLYERINNLERRPKGFAEAWQTAQQANANPTEKAFLQHGQSAWGLYYLAKLAADQRTRFPGQSILRRKISELEAKPLESVNLLAEKVAAGIDPDVHQKVKRWCTKQVRQRRRQRHRVTDTSSPPPSSSTSTCSSEPCEEARPGSFYTSAHIAEYEHVLVNASLAEATQMFPAPLFDAIKRIPHPTKLDAFVAALAMSFPNVPSKFRCQMTLEITENKIDNLAKDLFGAQLETTAGLRYVCMPDCAKILPNPKFTLQGCRHNVILTTFGPEVSSAIAASPTYQNDVGQWRSRTDCVWMVISHKANETAELCVSMGLVEGTLIRRKLYK